MLRPEFGGASVLRSHSRCGGRVVSYLLVYVCYDNGTGHTYNNMKPIPLFPRLVERP